MLRRADIDDHWEMVNKGLEVIMRKSPFREDINEIRAGLISGRLRLLIDPPYVGFFIVELVMKPEPHLFLWFGWNGNKEPLTAKYLPEIEAMARQVGAKYLELKSKRRGYERAGWEVDSITYRRGL